jgi:predicted ATPase
MRYTARRGKPRSRVSKGDTFVAHVTELKVEGLAGRTESLSVKLDRHINVFFGLNGSGKTSLLKILHSAMTGDATILENVPFSRAQVKIYSITYDKIFTRNCAKEALPTEETIDEPPTLTPTINVAGELAPRRRRQVELKWDQRPGGTKKQPQSWAHRYLSTARLYLAENIRSRFIFSPGRAEGLSEELLEESFAKLVSEVWSSYSATILGQIQRAQAEGLADILKEIIRGKKNEQQTEQLDPASAYDRVSRFLERQGSKSILGDSISFQQNYSTNPQLRSVVTDINKVEAKIQEAVAPRDKLQSMIGEMFSGNKKVAFTDAGIELSGIGDTKISLARLSSGEKQLIRILIDTLLAAENSFILDEPEISMHVDWQKVLIKSMRQLSPEAQFIIATHSPEIMADVKDESIFRL